MKRIITLLLVLFLFLSACSNSKEETILCSNCNEPISDTSKFCSNCGAEVLQQDRTEIFVPTEATEPQNETVELSFANVETQLNLVEAIFTAKGDEAILSLFPTGKFTGDGNILIDGMFSEMKGTYEIYCWNNQAYQIVFRWDENQEISYSDIVFDITGYIGEHKHYNDFWIIYEWEVGNIEITYETEEGVWFEQIFNKDLSEPVIEASSIDDAYYLNMEQEDVENEISTIRKMMSFRKMPKEQVFINYPSVVDDDWNQLLMPGTVFGIEGQFAFMYDDAGIIYSVAFDWLPDNMEKHEEHIVSCINKYFGNYTESHYSTNSGETYYYHDWDATTIENWSVHLSMTETTGWLQFSQLKSEKQKDEGYTCIECGEKATNSYTNPFSKQEEYYCASHYKEIIDILGDMEADVGQSDYSKHTCMECNREGTHQYHSFTGQTEYYCTQHYEELMDMLEELGLT